jgi:hypothetical protein
VFDQLATDNPGGTRCAVFRLADGVAFVHVAIVEAETAHRERPHPTRRLGSG